MTGIDSADPPTPEGTGPEDHIGPAPKRSPGLTAGSAYILQVADHVNGDPMTYALRTDERGQTIAVCKNGIEPCAVKLVMGWHKSLRARFGSEFGRNNDENRDAVTVVCTCDGGHGADLNCAALRVCAKAGVAVDGDLIDGLPRPEGVPVFESAIACALTHLNHTSLRWLLTDRALPGEFAAASTGDVLPLAWKLGEVYRGLRRTNISIDGVKAGLDDEVMTSLLTHDGTLILTLSNLVSLYLFDRYKISGYGEQATKEFKAAVDAARGSYSGSIYQKRGKEYVGRYAPATGFQIPERLDWVMSTITACGTPPSTLLWECEGSDGFEACGDDISFYIESRLTAWPKVGITEELVRDAVGRIGENGSERGLAALLSTDYTILHHAQEVLQSKQDAQQGIMDSGKRWHDENLPFSAARAMFFELAEHGLYQYMVDDMCLTDKSISYDGMMVSNLTHRVQDWGVEIGTGESLQTTLGLLRASYDAAPGICICEHLERVWVLIVTWVDHLLANEPLLRITGTTVASTLWIYSTGRHPAFDWERTGRNNECCTRPRGLQARRRAESGGAIADMRDLKRIYSEWDESTMKEPLMQSIVERPAPLVECEGCRLPQAITEWLCDAGEVQENDTVRMQREVGSYTIHLSTCLRTPRHVRRALYVRMFCMYMCSPAIYFASLGSLFSSEPAKWYGDGCPSVESTRITGMTVGENA
jgi:hypothetical protein